jgi:cell division protein FtsQ
MDDRGRIATSLTRILRAARRIHARFSGSSPTFKTALTVLLLIAGAGFGAIRGHHLDEAIVRLRDARDALASAAGFHVQAVALSGNSRLMREEILGIAGIGERTSLLFLDAAQTRDKLKASTWIADATVLKLYPDRLHIAITERHPYALWQRDGKVVVIAGDGTVVEQQIDSRFANFPLVVGKGAERQARDFLTLVDRFPAIRGQVQAFVLVAERRWNLRMKSGIDVRLPEIEPERALDQLAALERDKKIFTRDIASIDLRVSDRVTVRLSDAAARAREEAVKDLKKKKKGSDA